LNQNELNAINDAVQAYFGRLTRQPSRVGTSSSAASGELPEFDYTGLVAVSGAYHGCIYFTAPKLMLRYLLLAAGETLQSDAVFLGTAGEIAHTIASHASRQSGAGLEISPPTTLKGAGVRDTEIGKRLREQPSTVICIQWQALLAALVVDLEAADGAAQASGSAKSAATSSAVLAKRSAGSLASMRSSTG
jgi:chemotaxis protein CheX